MNYKKTFEQMFKEATIASSYDMICSRLKNNIVTIDMTVALIKDDYYYITVPSVYFDPIDHIIKTAGRFASADDFISWCEEMSTSVLCGPKITIVRNGR